MLVHDKKFFFYPDHLQFDLLCKKNYNNFQVNKNCNYYNTFLVQKKEPAESFN